MAADLDGQEVVRYTHSVLDPTKTYLVRIGPTRDYSKRRMTHPEFWVIWCEDGHWWHSYSNLVRVKESALADARIVEYGEKQPLNDRTLAVFVAEGRIFENKSEVPWLRCAECDGICWDHYLCKACR